MAVAGDVVPLAGEGRASGYGRGLRRPPPHPLGHARRAAARADARGCERRAGGGPGRRRGARPRPADRPAAPRGRPGSTSRRSTGRSHRCMHGSSSRAHTSWKAAPGAPSPTTCSPENGRCRRSCLRAARPPRAGDTCDRADGRADRRRPRGRTGWRRKERQPSSTRSPTNATTTAASASGRGDRVGEMADRGIEAAAAGGLHAAHCARLARRQGPPALTPVEPATLLGADPPRDDRIPRSTI